MPSVSSTGLDRAGRCQGWRPCACCVPTEQMVPTYPIDSTAHLRGAMIVKTCVILKIMIYVFADLCASVDNLHNGQPAMSLPYSRCFEARAKQGSGQSGQGRLHVLLFIVAANKLEGESKSESKNSFSLGSFSRPPVLASFWLVSGTWPDRICTHY